MRQLSRHLKSKEKGEREMCLSTAYKILPDGEDEKICEFISEVKVEDGKIVLTDIMGKEIEVPGTIRSMDFVGSKLMIGA